MVVEKIDQALIYDNPYNPRSFYNKEKIEELASSIQQIGLMEVPQARKSNINGHTSYQLAYGGYRRRAFKYLLEHDPDKKKSKWVNMPIDIVELTDEQMALFALEENLKRHDMTPMDTANAITKYFEIFPDTTEEQLGTKLSMTQGNISNMRRVVKLPKEILDKINDDKINFTMARELLVLQGVNAGVKSEWKNGKSVEVPVDDKELMLEAVRGVTGQYGKPTVNGIKKSIYDVAKSHFKRVDAGSSNWYSGEKTLFDTKETGCLKCGKMLKLAETQSVNAHFCTDKKCWEKFQSAHKKKAAEKAQKQMETDIATRIIKDLKQPVTNISQEIVIDDKTKKPNCIKAFSFCVYPKCEECPRTKPAVDPAETKLTKAEIKILETAQKTDLNKETEQEAIEAEKRRKQLKDIPDWPCLTCINIGKCDGTGVHAVDKKGGGSANVCDNKVLATVPAEKLTEKAKVDIPPELLDKVKSKAGTRGEILDIRNLRIGSYNNDMVSGHVLLNDILEQMEDHEECIQRCITGFHYGFNSDNENNYGYSPTRVKDNLYFVCTNPKCCSQKKAAFTRAKNARGMLRKKAETAAIKEATDKTEHIGKPEIELIFHVLICGSGGALDSIAGKLCTMY